MKRVLMAMTAATALSLVAACATAAGGGSAGANACGSAKVRLPILAWNGGDCFKEGVHNINKDYFRELYDAGYTITMEDAKTVERAKEIMDAAHKEGVKICLRMPQLRDVKTAAGIVAQVKDHPALDSYYVVDEPRANSFKKWGELIKVIQAADSKHRVYVNAFGIDAGKVWYMLPDFETYIKHYLDEMHLDWFSFDMYPVTAKNRFLKNNKIPFAHEGVEKELKPTWFKCFEVVQSICRERKIPFSAFALTVPHTNSGKWDYPPHTVGELKLESYVALAYGAESLQHFTYRCPGHHSRFHNAPIDYDTARRTPMYDRVREVNRELNDRAYVFVGADMPTVAYLGPTLPEGVKKCESFPAFVKTLEVADGSALVSTFKNNGKEYVMVVNCELEREITLNATFDAGVKRILKDGAKVDVSRQDGVYWLSVGDAEIFVKE